MCPVFSGKMSGHRIRHRGSCSFNASLDNLSWLMHCAATPVFSGRMSGHCIRHRGSCNFTSALDFYLALYSNSSILGQDVRTLYPTSWILQLQFFIWHFILSCALCSPILFLDIALDIMCRNSSFPSLSKCLCFNKILANLLKLSRAKH